MTYNNNGRSPPPPRHRARMMMMITFTVLLLLCLSFVRAVDESSSLEQRSTFEEEKMDSVEDGSMEKRDLKRTKRNPPKKKKKWCYQTRSKYQSVCRRHFRKCSAKVKGFQVIDSKGNTYTNLFKDVANNEPPVIGPIRKANVLVHVQTKCFKRNKKTSKKYIAPVAVSTQYKYNKKRNRYRPKARCDAKRPYTVLNRFETLKVGKHTVFATVHPHHPSEWPKPKKNTKKQNQKYNCCSCPRDKTVKAVFRVIEATPPKCAGLLGSQSYQCPAVYGGCVRCYTSDKNYCSDVLMCGSGDAAIDSSFDCQYRCNPNAKHCCSEPSANPDNTNNDNTRQLLIKNPGQEEEGEMQKQGKDLHTSIGLLAYYGQQQKQQHGRRLTNRFGTTYDEFRRLFEELEAVRKLLEGEVDELNDNPLVAEVRAIETLVDILSNITNISEEVYDAMIQFAECNSEPLAALMAPGVGNANAVLNALNGFLALLEGMSSNDMETVYNEMEEQDSENVVTRAAIYALKVWIKSQLPDIAHHVMNGEWADAARDIGQLKNLTSDIALPEWPTDLASLVSQQLKKWLFDRLREMGDEAGEALARAMLRRMGASAAGIAAILFIANDIMNLIRAFIAKDNIEEATQEYYKKFLEVIEAAQTIPDIVKPVNGGTSDPFFWDFDFVLPPLSTLTIRFTIKCWKQTPGSTIEGDGSFVSTPCEVTSINGVPVDPPGGSSTVLRAIDGTSNGNINVDYNIPPRSQWGSPGPCYVSADVKVEIPPNKQISRTIFLGALPSP